MKNLLLTAGLSLCSLCSIQAADLFVETESFANKGGWVVDQQFENLMGSPYLMAHGLGEPVADAQTEVTFPETGTYYAYVRTFNWTSPWYEGEGPGKFTLTVGKKKLSTVLGCQGNQWMWQPVGKVKVKNTTTTLKLHDLTGFNGRCDAIYFTTNENEMPPADLAVLQTFRREKLHMPAEAALAGKYDLVVVGGGIAGMSAAVSAGRLGCKVALLNDRPIWGGNNSSEVRVHLGGRIESGKYKEIGNLQKEFGPLRGGNARPAEYYEDQKKADWLAQEKNVTLFANYRAIAVEKEDDRIVAVIAKHIETGVEKRFESPLFVDCTGDGTIGYLAGADFRMGRESRDEFGESTAPLKADKMTMGASVQWYSKDMKKPTKFPVFKYGVDVNQKNAEKVVMGEWTWETGMNFDQIFEFERIRDYGLMVVYSNWSFLKNEMPKNDKWKNRNLDWVAYVAGKRESRRLLGDYILHEDDLRKFVSHEDGSAATTWTIDLHYPNPQNEKAFDGQAFKSYSTHIQIHPYPIPYRCLYSRNVDNLFMAGRNISVTHVALGTVRVMRTTGMMGEVVGMAASLCKKHHIDPRGVYRYHLDELKDLMKEGVGKKGLPNNQTYNMGGSLGEKQPEKKAK